MGKDFSANHRRLNPAEGYEGMAKRVNEFYARTGDIRETMRDTGLLFDCVFESRI